MIQVLFSIFLGLGFYLISPKASGNSDSSTPVAEKKYPAVDRQLLQIDWNQLDREDPPAYRLLRPAQMKERFSGQGMAFFWDLIHLIKDDQRPFWYITPHRDSESAKSIFPDPPLNFRVTSMRAQDFFDQLIFDLVDRSPTFRQIAKLTTGGNQYLAMTLLGVSSSQAGKIILKTSLYDAEKFTDPEIKEALRELNRQYQVSLLERNKNIPSLKYQLLYYRGKKIPLHSWTGLKEQTFIFLHPSDLESSCQSCDEEILKTVVHEIAIAADRKAERPSFAEFSKIYRGTDACLAFNVLADPQVRMALSTMRAYFVEKQVVSEINPSKMAPKIIEPLAGLCQKKMKPILTFNRQYSKGIVSNLLEAIDPPIYEVPCLEQFKNLTTDQKLSLLDQGKIHRGSQVEVSLCEYESTPQFISPRLRKTYPRGPRPRTGNGTG